MMLHCIYTRAAPLFYCLFDIYFWKFSRVETAYLGSILNVFVMKNCFFIKQLLFKYLQRDLNFYFIFPLHFNLTCYLHSKICHRLHILLPLYFIICDNCFGHCNLIVFQNFVSDLGTFCVRNLEIKPFLLESKWRCQWIFH